MYTPDTYKEEEIKFKHFLKLKGLRTTPERIKILERILDKRGHFDVDTLYKLLDKEGYHISKATLYHTIELICESGLIRKLHLDSAHALYEVARDNHLHLICEQCGAVSEYGDDIIKILNSSLKIKDFHPAYISAYVYGICSECMKIDQRYNLIINNSHKS